MRFLRYQSQNSNIIVLYLLSSSTEKSVGLSEAIKMALLLGWQLWLCLLPSDVCSGASESGMKLEFVFFWRPFPCEEQQLLVITALQPCRDLETEGREMLALSGAHVLSLRRQSSLEPLDLCRAAARQPWAVS